MRDLWRMTRFAKGKVHKSCLWGFFYYECSLTNLVFLYFLFSLKNGGENVKTLLQIIFFKWARMEEFNLKYAHYRKKRNTRLKSTISPNWVSKLMLWPEASLNSLQLLITWQLPLAIVCRNLLGAACYSSRVSHDLLQFFRWGGFEQTER